MDHKQKTARAQWGSNIGFILAAAGSAVGLGNIWKVPGKAYEGGGGAFILIYVAIVLLIGLPVMLAELSQSMSVQDKLLVDKITVAIAEIQEERAKNNATVAMVDLLIGM